MILLIFLAAGAFWLTLLSWFGPPAVIALATLLSVTSLIGVWSDLRAYGRDREIAEQRWQQFNEGGAT